VLSPRGEIDLAISRPLHAALQEAIAVSPWVVVDLSAVEFMDTTALEVLVAAHRRSHDLGGRLALAAVPRCVEKILVPTGVRRTLDSFPDVDTAAASLESALGPLDLATVAAGRLAQAG
jgi:anti-anti-sigma factor